MCHGWVRSVTVNAASLGQIILQRKKSTQLRGFPISLSPYHRLHIVMHTRVLVSICGAGLIHLTPRYAVTTSASATRGRNQASRDGNARRGKIKEPVASRRPTRASAFPGIHERRIVRAPASCPRHAVLVRVRKARHRLPGNTACVAVRAGSPLQSRDARKR